MNLKLSLGLAAGCLTLAGCATTPQLPPVSLPITYQIPIGKACLSYPAGPRNVNASATQDVTVRKGKKVYYQLISPVKVTMYVYEMSARSAGGNILGRMEGSTLAGALSPTKAQTLEFIFCADQADLRDILRLTLSDTPIEPPAGPNAQSPAAEEQGDRIHAPGLVQPVARD